MSNSRYRLQSSAFDRPDDHQNNAPKRVIFLSAEGVVTEKDYFNHLNRYLDASIVQVEMLKRKKADGSGDPMQVLGLLKEYIDVRKTGVVPSELPVELKKIYSEEDIKDAAYDSGDLDYQTRIQIRERLKEAGIDIEYRMQLYKIQTDSDFFGVIIDRDHMNHSREKMDECYNECVNNGYGCYITNPCFEFWLLLHLCDVNSEFDTVTKDALLDNQKVSERNTAVSLEVSKRAHHKKHISYSKFSSTYYPNIKTAVRRAKAFCTQYPDVLDKLGTNMPDLLREIGYIK